MKKIPSIILIGVGRWGQNHLRVWLRLHAQGLCNFIGVLDTDTTRRKAVAKEFKVKTFSDEDVLEKADAVDVVVPTYNHFAVAKKALKIGKDVLVEKPMTLTVKEAEALVKILKGSSRIFMVGHLFRYNPALDYVKKMIVDGEIGKIRFLRGRFMGFRDKEHDAGILTTTSIHFIYVSNHIMGKTPKKVQAKTNYMLDATLDDHCTIRLDYGREFSMIESDYFTPGKFRTFDIIGTQGSLSLDMLNQKVELHRKKHIKTHGRFEAYDGGVHVPTISFEEPLELELKHFLTCVKERREPLTGFKDGIDVLKIIEAAYTSSRTDKTISL